MANTKRLNKMKPREQVLRDQMKKDQKKLKELQDRIGSCRQELQGDRRKKAKDIRPR